MGTTVKMLRDWYESGVKQDATHMLVICDSFDHSDYPVYVMPGQDPNTVRSEKCQTNNMQRLMECYALHKPFNKQKSSGRFAMDFSRPKHTQVEILQKRIDKAVAVGLDYADDDDDGDGAVQAMIAVLQGREN